MLKFKTLKLSNHILVNIVVVIICVFVSVFVYTIVKSINNSRQVTLEEIGKIIPTVLVIPVRVHKEELIIKTGGFVNEFSKIKIASRVDGKITFLSPKVEFGGFVGKGEIIAQIDNGLYEQKLAAAESNFNAVLKAFENQLERHKLESQLKQELFELDKKGPESNVEVLSALAKLEEAKATVKEAKRDLDAVEIKAPFNCYVQSLHARLDQSILKGDGICEVVPADFAEISVAVSMADIFKINIPNFYPNGIDEEVLPSLAEIEMNEMNANYSWTGKILRFDGVNQETKLAHIIVKIKYDSQLSNPFRPGMFCKVWIHGRKESGTFVLPFDSIIDGRKIWIVDDYSKLDSRIVKILSFEGDWVVVRANIKEGDEVVIPRSNEGVGFTKGTKVNTERINSDES